MHLGIDASPHQKPPPTHQTPEAAESFEEGRVNSKIGCQ